MGVLTPDMLRDLQTVADDGEYTSLSPEMMQSLSSTVPPSHPSSSEPPVVPGYSRKAPPSPSRAKLEQQMAKAKGDRKWAQAGEVGASIGMGVAEGAAKAATLGLLRPSGIRYPGLNENPTLEGDAVATGTAIGTEIVGSIILFALTGGAAGQARAAAEAARIGLGGARTVQEGMAVVKALKAGKSLTSIANTATKGMRGLEQSAQLAEWLARSPLGKVVKWSESGGKLARVGKGLIRGAAEGAAYTVPYAAGDWMQEGREGGVLELAKKVGSGAVLGAKFGAGFGAVLGSKLLTPGVLTHLSPLERMTQSGVATAQQKIAALEQQLAGLPEHATTSRQQAQRELQAWQRTEAQLLATLPEGVTAPSATKKAVVLAKDWLDADAPPEQSAQESVEDIAQMMAPPIDDSQARAAATAQTRMLNKEQGLRQNAVFGPLVPYRETPGVLVEQGVLPPSAQTPTANPRPAEWRTGLVLGNIERRQKMQAISRQLEKMDAVREVELRAETGQPISEELLRRAQVQHLMTTDKPFVPPSNMRMQGAEAVESITSAAPATSVSDPLIAAATEARTKLAAAKNLAQRSVIVKAVATKHKVAVESLKALLSRQGG